MSLRSKVRSGVKVAVFTRIDGEHLKNACTLCKDDPKRKLTFRSFTAWVSAADAKPCHLYIAAADGRGIVEYVADLVDVEPKADRNKPRAKELSGYLLDKLKVEPGWENLRTMYVIQNCRPHPHPFPMTELIKLSDDKPISKDYSRAYTVVYPHDRH